MKTIIVLAAGALLLAPVVTQARDVDQYNDRNHDRIAWIKYDEGRFQQQQPTPAERAAASLSTEPKKLRDIKED